MSIHEDVLKETAYSKQISFAISLGHFIFKSVCVKGFKMLYSLSKYNSISASHLIKFIYKFKAGKLLTQQYLRKVSFLLLPAILKISFWELFKSLNLHMLLNKLFIHRSLHLNFLEFFQIFLYVSNNHVIIFVSYYHVPLIYIFPTPRKELTVSNLHFSSDTYYSVEGFIFLKGSSFSQNHHRGDSGGLIKDRDHFL